MAASCWWHLNWKHAAVAGRERPSYQNAKLEASRDKFDEKIAATISEWSGSPRTMLAEVGSPPQE
jgi:hypothetical protein